MSPRFKNIRSAAVLGLALFALFFGAGNLIFPPVIGLEGGTDWIVGYIAYYLADVGLALLGLFAMIKADGDLDGITGVLGKIPSVILTCAVVLCVGPLLAIPRTAATSFEMGASALTPDLVGDPVVCAIFSVIFFAIVFTAVLHPGEMVNRVGRILTPMLVIALGILIVSGIVNPAAQAEAPRVTNLLQEGVLNGYQTMDMIAALVFSLVVVVSINTQATESGISKMKLVAIACGVAAVFLFATYGGLAYIGATTGQLWGDAYMAGEINHAGLLSSIAESVVGGAGATVLAVVVVLACLTTAIGLVSACSQFIVTLFKEKISYTWVAAGMCVFSAFVCNLGLSQIVAFSSPVLSLMYPTAMFLVVMRLLPLGDDVRILPSRLGAVVAFTVSLCALLVDTFGVSAFSFIHMLPLDEVGFGWLVPTVAAALLGFAVARMRGVEAKQEKNS